jgi:hypothetical protein
MFWCVHRVWNPSLLRLPSVGLGRPCYKELLAHKSSGQIETSFTTCWWTTHDSYVRSVLPVTTDTLPAKFDWQIIPPSQRAQPAHDKSTKSDNFKTLRCETAGWTGNDKARVKAAAAARRNKPKSLRDILWLEYGSEKSEITFAPVGKLSWVVICCLTSSNCPALVHGTELSARTALHRHRATPHHNRQQGFRKRETITIILHFLHFYCEFLWQIVHFLRTCFCAWYANFRLGSETAIFW